MTKHNYNLKKQAADERDFQLKSILDIHPSVKITMPKTISLISQCPPIYDQLELGSCTANAGIADRVMLNKLQVNLSRLFQYYEERFIEGDVSQDGGAQMRDIGKAMQTYGVCEESYFPYDISKFTNQPTPAAVTNALKYKIKSYISVTTQLQIKQVLVLQQKPVLAGIDVYESFESDATAKTGIVLLPKKKEKLLGGHAILIVGYNDTKKWFVCRNSWGSSWGDHGYGMRTSHF